MILKNGMWPGALFCKTSSRKSFRNGMWNVKNCWISTHWRFIFNKPNILLRVFFVLFSPEENHFQNISIRQLLFGFLWPKKYIVKTLSTSWLYIQSNLKIAIVTRLLSGFSRQDDITWNPSHGLLKTEGQRGQEKSMT